MRVYNALDPATHFPAESDPVFAADLVFLGNPLLALRFVVTGPHYPDGIDRPEGACASPVILDSWRAARIRMLADHGAGRRAGELDQHLRKAAAGAPRPARAGRNES